MSENVTGIVVCHNTPEEIRRSYESIRRFHPEMRIIIVDGSDAGSLCAAYVQKLASEKTTVLSLGYNIGHGRGMNLGISRAKTKYAVIFDSDVEMLKSPIAQMLAMMDPETFGVGVVDDFEVYGLRMSYLHPHFHLIDLENYSKYHKYVHHGAPCFKTMLDIKRKGLSGKILKRFPSLETYVKHYHRGTRNERKRRRLPEIEMGWEER